MSQALYNTGGLRFWNENEIELREAFQNRAISVVKRTLLNINPAWRFERMEGPCLSPRSKISPAYNDDDIFITNHDAGDETWCLRAETTQSSYEYARHLKSKIPLCVYQSGKSFRRELSDGATAAKMRFNEFWQLEFQCIYSKSTHADYREVLMKSIREEIERFTQHQTILVQSDRLPSYSESTVDIEAIVGDNTREIASCSIRTDYSEETRVCEIAIGLCRVATLAATSLY